MLRRIGLCLAVAVAAAAKDPNQPVKRGSAEFSGGASYARYTGSFDSSGNYSKYPGGIEPAAYVVPVRIRWGLGNGFELRTDWSYVTSNEDAGSRNGLSQPTVALRYITQMFGVFGNVTLPFATGDLDNGDLHTILEAGGLVRFRDEHFRLTGLASYINDLDENQVLRAWFRPEVLWMPGFSTFVTGEFLQSLTDDAYLGTLGPGVRVDFTETFATELTTPFSVIGRNSPVAGWSVSLRGLWTLKL